MFTLKSEFDGGHMWLLLLIVQLVCGIGLVVAFAWALTTHMFYPPPKETWEDVWGALYIWPLMMYDAVFDSRNKYERIGAIILYLCLGAGQWIVWQWSLWIFIPAFVIGLPIICLISVLVIDVFIAVFGPTLIKKLKKLGKLTAPVRV